MSVFAADPHGTFGPYVASRDGLDAAFQWIGNAGKRNGGARGLGCHAPHTAGAHDERTARRTQEGASICFHASTSKSMGSISDVLTRRRESQTAGQKQQEPISKTGSVEEKFGCVSFDLLLGIHQCLIHELSR